MIHKIYAIYDTKAELYNMPFFMNNEPTAIRTFANACNDPNHSFGQNPEDYILFEMGTYDDELGTITSDHQKSITKGINLVKQQEENS